MVSLEELLGLGCAINESWDFISVSYTRTTDQLPTTTGVTCDLATGPQKGYSDSRIRNPEMSSYLRKTGDYIPKRFKTPI
jgi:hypothetical protein